MRTTRARLIACALVVSFLFLPAGLSAEEGQGARPQGSSLPPYKPRLRLLLSATAPLTGEGTAYNPYVEGSFLFPGDVPPLEKGPHPALFSHVQPNNLRDLYYGPLGLAYDWTENWSAEVELLASGRARGARSYAQMDFTSSSDGETYRALYQPGVATSFVSVLAGLTYRSKTPTVYERHAFELGAAVGPAWGRLDIDPDTVTLLSAETVRKVAISGRIHGGYDFLILPTLSVGAFLEYRSLEMRFAGSSHSSEVEFLASGGSGDTAFTRTTEVTLPGRVIKWSGVACGLRLGLKI